MSNKDQFNRTFIGLLMVFAMIAGGSIAVKCADFHQELKKCQSGMAGYSELEKKAECRR